MTTTADILARHVQLTNEPYPTFCEECAMPWPCDAYTAATEAQRLRAALEEVQQVVPPSGRAHDRPQVALSDIRTIVRAAVAKENR